MDFGKNLRKRKSEIKYEALYCSQIQSQRFTADKLSCSTLVETLISILQTRLLKVYS